ncbi:MAG: insulinase family protein [Candidatus Krumholzibacteria bacterium]|jgi:predicted Zn-dependent peptidase|nr:insulinase family protein [Candidatus Krumholzibacteria bacterium]
MFGKGERLFLLALAVTLALCCLGQAAFAQTLEEKVNEFELKNGMKFLVVERHEAPVAFFAIVFNVGSANEWPNVTGISHLLEHMMFKGTEMMGTKDYKKEKSYIEKTDELGGRTIALRGEMGEWRFEAFKDFSRKVLGEFTDAEKEEIGADKFRQNRLLVEKIRAMGPVPAGLASRKHLVEQNGRNYLDMYLEYETAWGEIARLTDEQRSNYIVNNELWETYMNNGSRMLNAGTSNDFTVYFVYLPANRMELWMTMESDRMDSPVFREFWTERDVVMEERRLSDNDPDDVLDEAFNSVAFTACPYKWPVLGWMSDLRTTDRDELVEYHRTHYSPNNATAVVVGDVDLATVKKMAKKYFESIPAQESLPALETREPAQQGERRLVIEHDANPKLMIGYHKPIHPDPEAVVFDVLTDVLAGGRTSRLYKSIYDEKKLTAEPPAVYTGPGERYDNLMIISAEPKHPHTLEEVEAAIYEEIEKLKTEPIAERELQRILNQLDSRMTQTLGSNLGIAFTVMMGEIFRGDWHAMFRQYDLVKEVTPEDVMSVSGKYLVPKNRTVAYRVQVKKEGAAGEGEAGEEVDQQALRAYIMSLPQEEMMAIVQKFQSMRSEAEAMEYAKELWEQAKAAGFGKDKAE